MEQIIGNEQLFREELINIEGLGYYNQYIRNETELLGFLRGWGYLKGLEFTKCKYISSNDVLVIYTPVYKLTFFKREGSNVVLYTIEDRKCTVSQVDKDLIKTNSEMFRIEEIYSCTRNINEYTYTIYLKNGINFSIPTLSYYDMLYIISEIKYKESRINLKYEDINF